MEHFDDSDENRLIAGSQSNTYNSIAPNGRELSNESGSGYTELLRGSVPCPTCKGLGNVPKEQEGQLIALIPMKDERLRPRRTTLWVCLAVFLCMVLGGLLLFFLFPRSVDMTSSRPYLEPYGPVYINETEQYVRFTLINHVNISNQNFVPLTIKSVKMTVQYDTQVIEEITNTSLLEVPIRADREYYVMANITLDKDNQMGYMAKSCKNHIRWAHEMVMLFQFTCNYEFFGHLEQTTLETFQFVSCYSKEKPTTIKPNTTTTTTTTSTTTTTTTTTTTKKPPL